MAEGTLKPRLRKASEPASAPPVASSGGKPANLQDQFLNHLRRE